MKSKSYLRLTDPVRWLLQCSSSVAKFATYCIRKVFHLVISKWSLNNVLQLKKVAKEFIYSILLGLQTEFFMKVGVVSFAADARLGTLFWLFKFTKEKLNQSNNGKDLPLGYYSTQNVTSNSVRDAILSMKYTGGYSSLGLIIGMVSQLYDFGNMNSRKVLGIMVLLVQKNIF